MEASENDTNSNRQESVGTSVSMAVCGGWWAGLTTFICISTRAHTSCHAAVRSLALPHTRHDTLLYVLSHFHTDVMLRSCTFSCTSTQTSRYAHVRSLALPHRRHATVRSRALPHTHVPILSVLLHFHTHFFTGDLHAQRTQIDELSEAWQNGERRQDATARVWFVKTCGKMQNSLKHG